MARIIVEKGKKLMENRRCPVCDSLYEVKKHSRAIYCSGSCKTKACMERKKLKINKIVDSI